MRILLIEPYFGGSHRAWAEGFAAASSHDVHLLTMPARWWTWRMRGAAITLAEETASWIERHGRPEVVLATDMLDLPAFLGMTRRLLGSVPVVLYLHESQFTYPWSPQQRPDLQYAYVNWTSMCAADRIVFNSKFHRDVVFDRLPGFLRQFPDYTHEYLIDAVGERSTVLPVGVHLARIPEPRDNAGEPPLILWNQRWEHDKAPEVFFDALARIADGGAAFRLAICGEKTRQSAPEFEAASRRFADRLVHFGYADQKRYLSLLHEADIVVSTALQEFFGIAIVEAVYAGAFPVLPSRLSYPEVMPAAFHDVILYDTVDELTERLQWAVGHTAEAKDLAHRIRPFLARYDWSEMAPVYDEMLASSTRSRLRN